MHFLFDIIIFVIFTSNVLTFVLMTVCYVIVHILNAEWILTCFRILPSKATSQSSFQMPFKFSVFTCPTVIYLQIGAFNLTLWIHGWRCTCYQTVPNHSIVLNGINWNRQGLIDVWITCLIRWCQVAHKVFKQQTDPMSWFHWINKYSYWFHYIVLLGNRSNIHRKQLNTNVKKCLKMTRFHKFLDK